MVSNVSYGKEPSAVHIEHRKTGVSDLWIRRNAAAPTNPEEEGWTAEEAYMEIDTSDCPTESEVLEDFDAWFAYVSSWKPKAQRSAAQMQADIDYIAAMCGIDLGV